VIEQIARERAESVDDVREFVRSYLTELSSELGEEGLNAISVFMRAQALACSLK
jgi:predicted solute-binding protein